LTTQKREDDRKHNGMGHSRRDTGLTRTEDTTGAGRESEEKTRAEGEEKRSGHEKVGLGEHKTHRASDETVHKEEHKGVEEDSHLIGLAVHELDVLARGGHENTGAEREKKGGGDSDFLGGNIGEHLVYVDIIFSKVNKVIKCSASHHFFVETIIIDHTS
jgi:hypothetical protein